MSSSKRKIIGFTVLFTAGLLVIGCEERSTDTVLFYPIDSLISAQIDLLDDARASVRKVAIMGDDHNTMLFTPDSITWAKEMDIFRGLGAINKPINREGYQKTSEQDSKSNLNVVSFTSVDDEAPVEYLKVFYDGTPDRLRLIEGSVRESNSMYAGRRFLSLEFQEIKGKVFLSGYSVRGGQKMFLGDSVNYSIKAGISLKR